MAKTQVPRHQRRGAISNAHVGREFEAKTLTYFNSIGLEMVLSFPLEIGVTDIKKNHCFDLGSETEKVIVECKSHTWTESGRVPSAKMTTWNQAMYYFAIAPKDYRKIMFVLKDYSERRKETLAQYYFRTYPHMIPADVELWEYSEDANTAEKVN